MQLQAIRAPADVELVARCRQGDRLAWRALYDRHAPLVFRFISALGVPIEEREDAAQEVFIAVYRSLAHFRGEAQLSTWIYRIAARHAGRIGRRRKVREVVSALMLRQPPPPAPPDPSERAAQLHFVDRLLTKLSPKKRTVFVLFEIEGVPVEEIAQIVGCPENTVWSRLHHARAELLKMVKKTERSDLVRARRRGKDAPNDGAAADGDADDDVDGDIDAGKGDAE